LYKVLLVDDEPLVLEGLKMMVDWRTLGYEVCGVAGNGEEALALIGKEAPDLVITDIRMPGLDGLGLIEQVINRGNSHPNVYVAHSENNCQLVNYTLSTDCHPKFIILSGFGEFEYAKKALHFGVNHYLLKPVFKDELRAVLRELHPQIGLQKQQGSAKEFPQCQNSLLVKDILGRIAHDELLPEDRPALAKFFSQNELEAPWSCLIVEIGIETVVIPEMDLKSGNGGSGALESRRVICREARRIFNHSSFILEENQDCLTLLISVAALAPLELPEAVQGLRRAIAAAGIGQFYLGVGETAPDLFTVANSYRSARQALHYKFFLPAGQAIFYSEVKNRTVNPLFDQITYLDATIDALEEFNPERLREAIRSAFAYFQTALMEPEIVKMFVINIIYHSVAIIHKMDGNPDELLERYAITHIEESKTTMADLQQMLQKYAAEFCQYLNTLRDRNSQGAIFAIEDFIKQNFHRNLTIKEIARQFYLHPAYLGQLFQKKFTFSFNEYLHRLRIQEAQRLMEDTAMKTHEIAAAVGYNNYHSFLNNFKKYTGYAPNDFKKRFGTEEDQDWSGPKADR
jgi:two-component system response regulator YesN